MIGNGRKKEYHHRTRKIIKLTSQEETGMRMFKISAIAITPCSNRCHYPEDPIRKQGKPTSLNNKGKVDLEDLFWSEIAG